MDLNEKDPCYMKTKYYCCANVTNRYPPDNEIKISSKLACVPAIYHLRNFEYKEADYYIKTNIKCLLNQPQMDFAKEKNCISNSNCSNGESCQAANIGINYKVYDDNWSYQKSQ
jgi:hypothetical protein